MIRLALALVALSAMPAAAQNTLCGARADLVASLASRYGEARLGAGLQPARGLYEVFVSQSGSWSIILSLPGGVSCLVAFGEAWGFDFPKVEVEGDPT